MHLTPTSSSWLNQVERFVVALLIDKKIRRGVYRSVAALRADITSFVERHNADPEPFRWTKSADDILASIERFCRYNAPIQQDAAVHPGDRAKLTIFDAGSRAGWTVRRTTSYQNLNG